MCAAGRLLAISFLTLGAGWAVTAQDAPKGPDRPAETIPLARLKADAALPIRMDPGAVAADDAVWLPDRRAGAVVRVDAKTNVAGEPVPVGGVPCASLSLAFGSLWVPRCEGGARLVRVDPAKGAVTATLDLGPSDGEGRIATGVGSVWVASDAKGVLTRVDPDANAAVAEIYLAGQPSSAVLDGDALWVTSAAGDLLTSVNPHSTEVGESVKVGRSPGRIAVGEDGVWVLNRGEGTVSRVDPKARKVVATIPVAEGAVAGDIAAGAGSVWVSLPGVPIVRIDPRVNRAVQRFAGDGGGAILVAHGSVWVAAGPAQTWRLDPKLVAGTRKD